MNMQLSFNNPAPVAAPAGLALALSADELFLQRLRDGVAAGEIPDIQGIGGVFGVDPDRIAASESENDARSHHAKGWYRTDGGGIAFEGFTCGIIPTVIDGLIDLGDDVYYQPKLTEFQGGLIFIVG